MKIYDMQGKEILDCPFDTLQGANLRGANLKNANFIDADLSGAYLMDADLSDAYLIAANLIDAKLCRANLIYLNFSHLHYLSQPLNSPIKITPESSFVTL